MAGPVRPNIFFFDDKNHDSNPNDITKALQDERTTSPPLPRAQRHIIWIKKQKDTSYEVHTERRGNLLTRIARFIRLHVWEKGEVTADIKKIWSLLLPNETNLPEKGTTKEAAYKRLVLLELCKKIGEQVQDRPPSESDTPPAIPTSSSNPTPVGQPPFSPDLERVSPTPLTTQTSASSIPPPRPVNPPPVSGRTSPSSPPPPVSPTGSATPTVDPTAPPSARVTPPRGPASPPAAVIQPPSLPVSERTSSAPTPAGQPPSSPVFQRTSSPASSTPPAPLTTASASSAPPQPPPLPGRTSPPSPPVSPAASPLRQPSTPPVDPKASPSASNIPSQGLPPTATPKTSPSAAKPRQPIPPPLIMHLQDREGNYQVIPTSDDGNCGFYSVIEHEIHTERRASTPQELSEKTGNYRQAIRNYLLAQVRSDTPPPSLFEELKNRIYEVLSEEESDLREEANHLRTTQKNFEEYQQLQQSQLQLIQQEETLISKHRDLSGQLDALQAQVQQQQAQEASISSEELARIRASLDEISPEIKSLKETKQKQSDSLKRVTSQLRSFDTETVFQTPGFDGDLSSKLTDLTERLRVIQERNDTARAFLYSWSLKQLFGEPEGTLLEQEGVALQARSTAEPPETPESLQKAKLDFEGKIHLREVARTLIENVVKDKNFASYLELWALARIKNQEIRVYQRESEGERRKREAGRSVPQGAVIPHCKPQYRTHPPQYLPVNPERPDDPQVEIFDPSDEAGNRARENPICILFSPHGEIRATKQPHYELLWPEESPPAGPSASAP